MSNTREVELGTNPNKRDTYGLANYKGGEVSYSEYAGYADQELFCRNQSIDSKGDASKDWSYNGAQSPLRPQKTNH